MTMQPQFIESAGARLFALEVLPEGEARGAILYLPPFAEEMNRCRAIVAEQARAFAKAGYACLLLDPFGTGESEGELEAATWEIWQRNALDGAAHLAAHRGQPPVLWGFRLGALLAATVAAAHPGRFERLLLWQPVADGKLFVTQYLRQRVAYLMGRDLPAETTDQMRAALADGQIVEVAGYGLAAPLVDGIGAHKLSALRPLNDVRIDWFENVAEAGAQPPVAARRAADALAANGARLDMHTFVGAPLWQLHKRDEAPELVRATSACFADAAAARVAVTPS